MNYSFPIHIKPEHLIIDIHPESKPLKKIFSFPSYKSINQIIKEGPRVLQSLSLNNLTQNPLDFQLSSFISKLKKIKFLKQVNIDLEWLSYIHHKDAYHLFAALKHLKNPPKLHFHVNKSHVIFLRSKMLSLCETIKTLKSLPKMQIEISLKIFGLGRNENFKRLLETFSQLKGFISADLNFLYFTDISEIQDLVTPLKNSKSLSKINVALELCTLDPPIKLQNLFERIKEIKALRNSRVEIKKSHTITYSGLQGILSPVKEISKRSHLEIIFDDCVNEITVFDWWSFARALKKMSDSHTVSAKFIGNKGRIPAFLTCLLLFFVAGFVFLLPIIMTLCTGANN